MKIRHPKEWYERTIETSGAEEIGAGSSLPPSPGSESDHARKIEVAVAAKSLGLEQEYASLLAQFDAARAQIEHMDKYLRAVDAATDLDTARRRANKGLNPPNVEDTREAKQTPKTNEN